MIRILVVQPLSCVWLFVTPWTAACHASPSLGVCSASCPLTWWCHPTISSFVIPFSSALSLSQHQGLFQWVSSCIRWPKYWSFSISPANEYSRLIHFKIDWFDLLAVQGTLKTLGILRNVEKKIFFSMNCASKTDLIRNSEVLLEVKYWILAPFPCFNRTSSLLPI